MFKSVFELFRNKTTTQEDPRALELATAALVSEIIRADRETDPREISAYKTLLANHFSLSDQELKLVMDEGRDKAEQAVDFVQFTKVVNQKCNNDEKQAILLGLWEVAYADKSIAPIEEHMIRRIADLLHIPHSQFIKAKLSVTE
ncbi:TerB family tellurite resistance protein [Alteromonas sp. C1M14]|uniref:tellurite resistance TerB family protein n=1 Tax=Alteromonas sp. C1M14 TaxID=2841567 RepID=UPI001C094767|nr:TerB family tellurite resistance protein [Alteromonas sp. C1M14]MBU2977404.1 TerB family tellurite resistance protein [Alteromonas sp. C1M14]